MRFIGSVVWDWNGKVAFRLRNKISAFVCPNQIFLESTGKDPRYVEFFQDHAGQIWVRRPAGSQTLLAPPYTLVNREKTLVSREVT